MVYNQMGYLSTALVNVTFKRKRRKPKQNKITHRCQNYQCHRLHYHCLQKIKNRKRKQKTLTVLTKEEATEINTRRLNFQNSDRNKYDNRR